MVNVRTWVKAICEQRKIPSEYDILYQFENRLVLLESDSLLYDSANNKINTTASILHCDPHYKRRDAVPTNPQSMHRLPGDVLQGFTLSMRKEHRKWSTNQLLKPLMLSASCKNVTSRRMRRTAPETVRRRPLGNPRTQLPKANTCTRAGDDPRTPSGEISSFGDRP